MKRIIAAIMALVMMAGMTLPAMAMEKLLPPSGLEWKYNDGGEGLYACFEENEAAEGEYKFEIYKDGELFHSGTARYASGRLEETDMISKSGSYTFRLKTVGDGVQYADSEWSDLSEPYVYVRPEESLGGASNLRWSEDQPGIVEWTGIDHADNYVMSYRIRLYKDGQRLRSIYTKRATRGDVSQYIQEEGHYTFSVTAMSINIEEIAHGPEIMCETSFDVTGNNNSVLNDLENVNSLLKGDKASASNAERALEKLDIKELAIAAQSSEESLQAIADLEQDYLALTKKEVVKQVDSEINVEADEIQIIGAGLNIATDSNAIRVSFKKPDKEANVDNLMYKNTVQFDISLTGAAKSLRAPITLIMPIPEGILPSRLRILHFHDDGSSEIITPVITEDGKAKFTVTRFSIFAFAEEIVQNGNSGGNGHSSSSGGSKKVERQSGSWIQSEKGWWFKEADGTWPANQWKQLMWNGSQQWYFFDQEGYMKTGWLDWNGKRYYLHAVSDGTMGHMYTGWRMIDGLWYYFDADGALLVNSTTPDGYQTDSNGIWVQ